MKICSRGMTVYVLSESIRRTGHVHEIRKLGEGGVVSKSKLVIRTPMNCFSRYSQPAPSFSLAGGLF